MKSLRKVIGFGLTAILAISLTACGSSGSSTSTVSSENTETSTTVEAAGSEAASTEDTDWQGSLEGVELSFGTAATFGPFTYFDEDGTTVIGYDIDLLNKLEELLGFTIDDNGIQTMDYSALTTSLSDGKLDMVISALGITDERKEVMDFSDPYYQSTFALLINKETSPDDITGFETFFDNSTDYKVACGNGTAAHLLLQREGVSDSNIEAYDTIPLALQALEAGKVQAMVYDNAGASYYIRSTPDTKLEKVGDPYTTNGAQYGVALSFDTVDANPGILDSINSALAYLKSTGYLDELEKKWCE